MTRRIRSGVAKAYSQGSLRKLNYRGIWKSPSSAKRDVDHIGRYNRFTPAEAKRLMSIKGVSKVRVARESSPAIYFLTTKPVALIRAKSTADEKRVVRKIGRKHVVRFWWD